MAQHHAKPCETTQLWDILQLRTALKLKISGAMVLDGEVALGDILIGFRILR